MYFGTDGIRGIANRHVTASLAQSCGNALTALNPRCRVVIGRDTRVSGSMLLHAFAGGVMQGGGEVMDVGIMPTAGVAYLTKRYHADFGVVISASHNPPEYNGIKIFDKNGFKAGDALESEIERAMAGQFVSDPDKVGGYTFLHNAGDTYVDFLLQQGCDLSGKKILLDCSNGAAYKIAPQVFGLLGAQTDAINVRSDGRAINERAGALWAHLMCQKVVDGGYDMGFAFDGDSDRLIAVDERGQIADGDRVLYMLAMRAKAAGKLDPPIVVGTSNTNMGVEKMLAEEGIELLRADVGDKFVLAKMLASGARYGSEQSGHVLLLDCATTGDGILTAVALARACAQSDKPFSALGEVRCFAQSNIGVVVKDKIRLINSEALARRSETYKKQLGEQGRVLLRASGTEPKLRIMVECENCSVAEKIARELAEFILELDAQI